MTETVRAFERGLRVIRCFGAEHPSLTLSEVAASTELSRATARRSLLTLEELGYVRRAGDRFTLTPKVLDLGYAYLSSFAIPDLALPYLEHIREELGESSSIGVLDESEITYVARVPAARVMTVSIGLGTRFPAFRTALGQAMLADLDDEKLAGIWAASDHRDPTPRTVGELEELHARLAMVRSAGFALADQELAIGVRSVAAPLHDASGRTIAAINISSHASRTTVRQLKQRFVPALCAAARSIDHALASRPPIS